MLVHLNQTLFLLSVKPSFMNFCIVIIFVAWRWNCNIVFISWWKNVCYYQFPEGTFVLQNKCIFSKWNGTWPKVIRRRWLNTVTFTVHSAKYLRPEVTKKFQENAFIEHCAESTDFVSTQPKWITDICRKGHFKNSILIFYLAPWGIYSSKNKIDLKILRLINVWIKYCAGPFLSGKCQVYSLSFIFNSK